MEHVVFFPTADGAPSYRRVPGLDEAVRLVEHLRNVEGIDNVSCHALTDVPLAFRPYYRVEVGAPEVVAPEVVAPESVAAEPSYDEQPVPVVEQVPVPEQPQAEQLVATAQSNGSRPRGANSLGFFA